MTTANRCPERALNDIWRVFNVLGITDDLTIIEHLTFVLLVWHAGLYASMRDELAANLQATRVKIKYSLDALAGRLYREWDICPEEQEVPAPPNSMEDERLLEVLDRLEDVLEQMTPAGLLNHCLLFRLPNRLAGGRYPTPRHIARTMASLVNVREGESLADLACGSGGLLVAAADKRPHVTGIEISPNWERIAWANVVLHDLPKPTIRTANSLTAFRSGDPPVFDCILMNPSFGVPVDRAVLHNAPLEGYGSRSETLLTAQSLAALRPGGRMAVLLPAGSLFTSSTGELHLRRELLESHRLQAIIALNKDAFQPYSTTPTFILLAEKRRQVSDPTTAAVWFYRVATDGLTPGRNRQPDPEHNDLPLVEAAVQAQARNPDRRLADRDGSPLLEVRRLQDGDRLLGYCFTRQAEGTIALRQLSGSTASVAALLAELRKPMPAGYLLVRDGTDYTGLPDLVQLPLQLPGVTPPVGQYLLPDEHETVLTAEEGSAKLTVGKRSHDLEPRRSDTASQPMWFLVDNGGHPISAPLAAETNILPSPIRPNPLAAIPLTLENGEPAGHLLVANAPLVGAVRLAADDGECIHLTELPSGGVLLWEIENGELRGVEVLASAIVFAGDKRRAGVVVDKDGSWFGVQVPVAEIRAPAYDLQPATYFPTEVGEIERRSPAQLLGDIKTHQQDLERRIDYLLGMAEMRPLAAIQLPPAVEDTAQPMGHFTGIQRTIWERIRADYRGSWAVGEGDQRITPKPFQPQDLGDDLPSADVQRTLDLFERMGLIVQVTYEGAPYYRLVADRDLVKQDDGP